MRELQRYGEWGMHYALATVLIKVLRKAQGHARFVEWLEIYFAFGEEIDNRSE